MPLTAKGEKILNRFKQEYGSKGESYFYAAKNKGTITGVDSADDMSDEEWNELKKSIAKWIDEEKKEPAHGKDANGKLTGSAKSEDESSHGEREEQPEGVFLEPKERKYPVKEKKDGTWAYSRNLLLAAAREARMHGHEDLASRAEAIRKREFDGAEDSELSQITIPEKSKRHYDENGFLHVKDCNISKACVNPYRGDEIPRSEELGLDPNKIYYLLRDPKELAAGASTFHNLPITTRHVTQKSDDPRPELRTGTTGTDTRFEHPYLKNTIAIWDDPAIAGIEEEVQRELSSSYRYDADMVPGEYEGTKYDGVMRNIRGNHVALVENGRAGSDVVVGDKGDFIMPVKTRPSAKAVLALGAITGFVAPRLAQDKRCDLTGIKTVLQATNAKNWLQQKPRLATTLTAALRGNLANDADLDDIHRLLDSLDREDGMSGDEIDTPMGGAAGDEEETEEEKRERMERRAADRRAGRDCAGDEEPETEEEKEHRKEARDRRAKDRRMGKDAEEKEREEAEKEHKAEDRKAWDRRMAARDSRRSKDGEMVSKEAMDAALRATARDTEARVVARMNAVAEAKRMVLPIVGDVVGMDSADDIYRFALEHAGVNIEGVPPAAFPRMTEMYLTSQRSASKPAFDSGGGGGAAGGSFGRFIDSFAASAKRIG